MNVYGWGLVIFLTALAVLLGFGWLLGRGLAEYDRIMLRDKLDQDVTTLPQLPRAGRFDVTYLPGPPFAGASDRGYELVDTGPLLLLSETMAANDALSRSTRRAISETDWLIEEAERKIGPVR